ncbi:hypothetical protein QBC35DRAFT_526351 [Podospora australis]|uniref:NACHT domain-containing protein n=1 Tax=Podospora australis TaxID=1536484 RepID=A0AAN6WJ44_9PEZI|nr:hypothetical protein QBC35DRAFT_526351 [Podospora australis]
MATITEGAFENSLGRFEAHLVKDPKAGEAFRKSVERFRERLTADEKNTFSMMTDLNNVKATIKTIQDKKGPEKRLPNFKRLDGILEGMKQVEELVAVFLNVSEFVAFVWGPVTLALVMASNHAKTLEVLINAYQDVGEFLSGLGQLDRLFQNYSGARQVLEDCFDDVLRFHQAAIEELTRPSWKKVADSVWPQLNKRFGPILKSLENRKKLLSDSKLSAAIEEIQNTRGTIEDKLDVLSKALETQSEETRRAQERLNSNVLEILRENKESIVSRLDSLNYNNEQDNAFEQVIDATSGCWILKEAAFENWVHGETRQDAILYLNGMPGSGKTTLVSQIIHDFESRIDDGAVLDLIQKRWESLRNPDVIPESFLKELGEDCILLQRRCWIVLDGLDECDQICPKNGTPESVRLINWFLEQILPDVESENGFVRLLISGQRDGHVDQVLSGFPSINLDTMEHHKHDIQLYTYRWAAEIRKRFNLDHTKEREIAEKVGIRAKGMFLYAKVVLHHLRDQESLADLKQELSQDNFPENLEAAYERVVVRILNQPNKYRQKTATTILGWLICSPRPLRWREIQSIFCINTETAACDIERKRVDNVKIPCGSLVELRSCEDFGHMAAESMIDLVHSRARRYLIQKGRFSLLGEHTKAAVFCTQYLASPPFHAEYTTDKILASALSGYYGLLDYAVTSWQGHVRYVTESNTDLDQGMRSKILESTKYFVATHSRKPTPVNTDDEDSKIPTGGIVLSSDESPGSSVDEALQDRVALIRQVIEHIEPGDLTVSFTELNGTGRYKCSRPRCHKFTEGFFSQQLRHSHILQHERPFNCGFTDCYAQTFGYSSKEDLDAHIKRAHSDSCETDTLFPVSKASKEKTVETIHDAARQGDLEQVKAFVNSGASIDTPLTKKSGKSPLLLATKAGHFEVCRYLIQQGANPLAALNEYSFSPLVRAMKRKDLELVKLYLSTVKDVDYNSAAYLIAHAVYSWNSSILDETLKFSTTHQPAKDMFPSVIRFMIYGASFSEDVQGIEAEPLQFKILVKQAFPSLFEPGSLRQRTPCTPFEKSELGYLQRILTNAESDQESLVYRAVSHKKLSFALLSVDFLDDKHLIAPSENQDTLLHALVCRDYTNPHSREQSQIILSRILEATNGAVTNMKDSGGNTPLHKATNCRDTELLTVLMQHTTNLDEENDFGQSPLERAIDSPSPFTVSLLINSGRINLGRTTRKGESMLEYAQRVEREFPQKVAQSVLRNTWYNKIIKQRQEVVSLLTQAMEGT